MRWLHLLALSLTIALGLLSRLCPLGWPLYDHSLGDVLYAVATYLALALLLPRWRPSRLGLLALALCVAIEAFQAAGIPMRYDRFLLVRWLIGSMGSWHDIVCYAGVGTIALLDAALRVAVGEKAQRREK